MINTLGTLLLSTIISFSSATKPVEPKREVTEDSTLAETYDPSFKAISRICVNSYVDSLDDLTAFEKTTKKPTNLVLYIDANGNLTDSKGTSLDITYADAYTTYINKTMIPCYYIKDSATAETFINYWNTEFKVVDISVISNNAAVLLKVRKEIPAIRGILDYSETEVDPANYGQMVYDTHAARANTVILNKNNCNKEAFAYFQARLQTVWANDIDSSSIEILAHGANGANGILVKDTTQAFAALNNLANTENEKYNFNRPAFNVAHRGCCITTYENSMEGYKMAYENGATHFEVDIQITKDNKLAIMHDDTIERTTTGTGKISDWTAEELKQFKIDTNYKSEVIGEGVAIPMLDEVFNEFKGKDIVIVVEIKTSTGKCVDLLKEYLDAAGIYDQVIVISFYTTQLTSMRDKIPGVPCADLNNYSQAVFEKKGLKTCNTGNWVSNSNTSQYSVKLLRTLNDRGYSPWFWTYEAYPACVTNALVKGVAGITNNVADTFGVSTPKGIDIATNIEVESFDDIPTKANVLSYKGDVMGEISISPLLVEEGDNCKRIVFSGKYNSGNTTPKVVLVLFSEIVTFTIKTNSEPTSETSENPTNNGCGGTIASGYCLLFAALMIFAIHRKKETL